MIACGFDCLDSGCQERKRGRCAAPGAARQVIHSAWFERHDLDRWLARELVERIADELRELRSAAGGERRDSGLQR